MHIHHGFKQEKKQLQVVTISAIWAIRFVSNVSTLPVTASQCWSFTVYAHSPRGSEEGV